MATHGIRIAAQGCAAGGYRLLADDGTWSRYCCRHLSGHWRVISTFEPDAAIVVAIGEHDGAGFYRSLTTDPQIAGAGRRRAQKPDCCTAGGSGSHLDRQE